MTALLGIGVLVTRPEQQAMPLCRLLAAEGAVSFPFPAIDIKPLAERRDLIARVGQLEHFDLIVFVSANAVRFGAQLLDQKRDLPLAAVGPATARALNQAGYRVAVVPADGVDSEALLAHPRLQHLVGRRILIIKGSGGRELLATALAERGAIVELADVYERVPATRSAAELAELERHFAADRIQVITATSVELGASLLRMATPALRAYVERVHWLVPSARVAESLGKSGLRAPLVQAASAEDHDLVAALIRWRSSVSGA